MRRPRLLPGLPVLARATNEVQIGLNPAHAVVVNGDAKLLTTLLAELDGRHTLAGWQARVTECAAPHLRGLLDQLAAAGLVEDGAAQAPLPPPQLVTDTTTWHLRTSVRRQDVYHARASSAVEVRGDGRLAIAVACLLASAGVGWVHTRARGTVSQDDVGTGYAETDIGVPKNVAARRAVRRVSGAARTGPRSTTRDPDLVVLADAAVPPTDVVSTLTSRSIPHLLVRMREGAGWVGPFVEPGRTSCLRCLDLHRTDQDMHWPLVAAQLTALPMQADLASASATAAFAAGQALHALAGARELLLRDAAVVIDLFAARSLRREWSPHPRCGCPPSQGQQAHDPAA
jgi:bacteriocin biosynthesis cyclodehydratase domain-containing protein